MPLSNDDISAIATQEGVQPEQLLAILGQENSDDSSVSSAGARGRGQLLPATFKSVNPDGDITNPADNVTASARYLKQGLAANGGDFSKAAAYYYAGPSWQKKIQNAPGAKYGTNPDGSGGISIEDYANNATKKLAPKSAAYAGSPGLTPDSGGDFDINAELAKLSLAANTQLEKVGAASDSLGTTIKANLQDQVATLDRQGQLEATKYLDEYRQKATQAAENAKMLTMAGINTSDGLDQHLADSFAVIQQEQEEANGLRASITDRKSVGLFDSPLDYFINQFTLSPDIKRHNMLVDDIDSRRGDISAAITTARGLQDANAAKFTSVSYEGAQAAAETIRNKAHLDALKLEDAMLKTDFETQGRTLTILNARMRNLEQLQTAQTNNEVKQTLAQTKADKVEAQQRYDQSAQVAGNILGVTILDGKDLDKKPKDLKNAIQYIMANDGGIGKDPLDALQVLRRGNPAKMPGAVKGQYNLLSDVYTQATAAMDNDPLMKGVSDRNKQMAYVSSHMQQTLNSMAEDPNFNNTDRRGNPYHVPSNDIMKSLPDAMNLKLTKFVDNAKTTAPDVPMTDSLIAQLAYAQVGKPNGYKDMTEAAQEVAKYYQAGVKFNNEKVRFNGFGMPDQETYKIKGGTGVNKMTDLTSYPQVMAKFLKQQSDKAEPLFYSDGPFPR